MQARRRLIHLPWFAAAICGVAWFLCIPIFLGALLQIQYPLDARLLWHLPISFCISGFIVITHTFFLVELASHWGLFPVFFRDARADLTPNIFTLSLRGRGIMWAVSASICPDRITSSPDVCAAFSGHERRMAGGFRRSGGNCVRHFHGADAQLAHCQANRSTTHGS
jgi:hypothetical protein